jgi:cytochrome c7-like protein
MSGRHPCLLGLCLAGLWLWGLLVSAAQKTPAKNPPTAAAASSQTEQKPFFLHAFHVKQLGLDCSTCHVPEKEGSIVLQRPGHDQCAVCHQDDFGANLNPKVCAQCHATFPPSGKEDLLPFPQFEKKRSILLEFSHARHDDPHGRNDSRTGFRADCTFCHHFDAQGVYAAFPGHTECATCHAKTGMKPLLSADSTTADCRGCHMPEAIENPALTEGRRQIPVQVVSGTYAGIKFSHIAHFKFRQEYQMNCTTCHNAVLTSTSLEDLTLPKMIDCAECHDAARTMPVQLRMSNCYACHTGSESATFPPTYSPNVKPALHTASFRLHHEAEASAPGANCYLCHTAVSPSEAAQRQCESCHQVMVPASHTTRWRDDLHGKYAAIDRRNCTVCHTADFCSRCHNELPRSHVPLPLFKGGAHANLAMLNLRSCFTCHTFENTCAECHVRNLR